MKQARRTRRAFAGVFVALAVVVFTLLPALAFTGTPDDTWMTNGTVFAVVRAGDYVYVAGQFTKTSQNPPGQAGDKFAAGGIARLNASTGVVDKSWKVTVTNADGTRATVRAIAVAGGQVFFGGDFDRVDGQVRSNIAAVSEADGTLSSFAPLVNNNVMSMVSNGSTVYVGGAFTAIDSVGRKRLAAFDTGGNLLSSWRPRTSAEVRSVILDCSGTKVYAGGRFLSAAGNSGSLVPRDSIALFDGATGAIQAWATRSDEISNGANAYDLAVSCVTPQLFAGIGGTNFIYAFDTSDDDGQTLWFRQTAGNVQTVAVNDQGTADPGDDRVLFGGHFGGGVTYPSGACDVSKPKTTRFGVATLDGDCDLTWWPNFDGKFYGPWDILVTDNGDRVWVGGQYTQVCDGNTNACASQYFLSRFTDV
jgi:hypothetical protein